MLIKINDIHFVENTTKNLTCSASIQLLTTQHSWDWKHFKMLTD